MNSLSTYARCLPRILCQIQMHSFRSKDGFLKILPSSQLDCVRHLSGPFFFTTICRTEDTGTESSGDRKKRLIIERDPTRNRRIKIPVETSIRYLRSQAYKECYGEDPVWKHYRRNHKGGIPPRKTRKMCIRDGVVATGNPCPICRDEYLVVDVTNLDLLKQFISPYSGELISYKVTGVCQEQYDRLEIAFYKAKDLGLVTFDVPFRKYDYSEYEETL